MSRPSDDKKRSRTAVRSPLAGDPPARRSWNDFLPVLNHAIRTPLTGILGMSRLLVGARIPAEERRHAEVIHSSAESLLQLIDEILDLSKIEAGHLTLEPEDFRLRDLVKDTVEVLVPRAKSKRLDLRFSVADGVADELSGDAERLRKVLFSLIGNAVKFTDRGFVFMTVTAEEPEEGDGERPWVRFSVRDTGVGIEPDQLPRIFEPFAQRDASDSWTHGSHGLGLSISQGIVELMGGRIGVESTLSQGSTFTFAVPFEPARDPAALASRPPSDAANGKSLRERRGLWRVLVAEDDEVNRMLALRVLSEAGFKADAVTNGMEALEALEKHSYNVVLMDCQMPGLDGFEATRLLRQIEKGQRDTGYRHIPVIAVTALTMKGDRERCVEAGMDSFVAKPYRSEELIAAVDQHLGLGGAAAAPTGTAPTRDGIPTDSVDADVFRQLLEFSKNKQAEFLTTLIDTFVRKRALRCDELTRALEAGEGAGLARLSHKLISASGSVGAYKLAKLAGDLEVNAREDQLDSCQAILAELVAEYERAETALLRILDGG